LPIHLIEDDDEVIELGALGVVAAESVHSDFEEARHMRDQGDALLKRPLPIAA